MRKETTEWGLFVILRMKIVNQSKTNKTKQKEKKENKIREKQVFLKDFNLQFPLLAIGLSQ